MNQTIEDADFVLALYSIESRGARQVRGQSTRTNYGYREGMEKFLVHKDDIRAQPHLFLCPDGERFTDDFLCPHRDEAVQAPPPPPKPIKALDERTVEEIEQTEISALQEISGIGPATAKLLHRYGITNKEKLDAASEEDLKSAGLRPNIISRLKQ